MNIISDEDVWRLEGGVAGQGHRCDEGEGIYFFSADYCITDEHDLSHVCDGFRLRSSPFCIKGASDIMHEAEEIRLVIGPARCRISARS